MQRLGDVIFDGFLAHVGYFCNFFISISMNSIQEKYLACLLRQFVECFIDNLLQFG